MCMKRTMFVGMNNEDTERLTILHNKPRSTEINTLDGVIKH